MKLKEFYDIIAAVKSQKNNVLKTMRVIQRKNYLNKLEELMNSQDIKVITGMRRCGKSVILSQFREIILKKVKKANILFLD